MGGPIFQVLITVMMIKDTTVMIMISIIIRTHKYGLSIRYEIYMP